MDPESGRTLEAGRTLGHYRLLERIGAGGMGEVWRARDERLERDVALKVLLPGVIADEAARKRFRREALVLSKLNHPHIAMVFDFDHEAGHDFLVMEYVSGVTPGAKREEGPLAEAEVVRLGLHLAEGLAAAHGEGIVHRDLKPANVRLTSDGRLKILDFGLARLVQPSGEGSAAPTQSVSLTDPGVLLGTLAYMAPEQLRGESVDARTDLWAAGLVLYELATGRRGYEATGTAPLIHAVLNVPVTPPRKLNAHLSRALEAIILRCVEKDASRRYGSAHELGQDLARLKDGLSVAAERDRERARRTRLLAVAGPTAVVAVLVAWTALDVGGIRTRLLGDGQQIRSIAVLPLSNLSGDPDQEYFADGMTEALINDLGQIGSLRIVSRTSSMQYKGTKKGLKAIARELGVDGIVEGSVVRAGDQVMISAQLIHAARDRQLWAQRYERQIGELLVMQSDLAQAITRQVQARLTPAESARLSAARKVDAGAHDAYLKGMQAKYIQSDEGKRTALAWFQKAVLLDPTYAPAFAEMAHAYSALADLSMPRALAVPRARAAAARALQLDSLLSEAHVAMGTILGDWDLDLAGAEREFKRSIQLNPGSANARVQYGHLLRSLGQYRRDLEQTRLALKLDPLDTYLPPQIGWAHYFGREYGEARREFLLCLRADPNSPQAHFGLGLALEQGGDYAGASKHMATAFALYPVDDVKAALVHTLAVSGRSREARAVLDSLVHERRDEKLGGYPEAIAYIGLGEHARALEELGRALEDPTGLAKFLNVDPRLDPLRADPRFAELLRRFRPAPR